MIPLTQEELERLSVPGDVVRRATLEPFHFEWQDITPDYGDESYGPRGEVVLDCQLDGADHLQVLTKAGSHLIGLSIYDEATASYEEHDVGVTYSSACLWGGHYYYAAGASVWRDNEMIFAGDNTIGAFSVVAQDEFYYYYNTASNTNLLVRFDGTNEIPSDIYWCDSIGSFRAVRLADHDVVLIGGQLPSYMSASTVTGNLVWQEDIREGVVSFIVNVSANGDVWSDHYNVEVNETDSQHFLRMSAFNTYDGKVGAIYIVQLNTVFNTFLSVSADGRSWCLPIPMEYPGSEWTPFIVVSSKYVYAISRTGTWRSVGFELFGVEPEALDISNDVIECTFASDQRSSINLILRRTDTLWEYVNSGALLLRLFAGFTYASDASIEKPIFVGEQDMHAKQNDYVPNNTIPMQFRDVTSWLDRTTSPVTIEANAATALLDDYSDDTGTGFGGLSRTAAYKGSWKTEEGALSPLTDGTNLALNTSGNFLNGMASVEAIIEDTTTDGIGIAYRAITDSILMALLYKNGSVKLERRDTENNTIVGNYAIDLGLTPKLRAEWSYGMHRGYYSMDGKSWIKIVETELPEHCYYGAVGVIAEQVVAGYTPDPWEPPDWEPPFVPPIEPGPIEAGTAVVVAYYIEGILHVFYCADVFATTPAWSDITGTLDLVQIGSVAILDATVYISTDGAVYYCTQPQAASPTWSSLSAPAGYTYGNGVGMRPFVQRSPDNAYLLIDVWSGNARYAWVIDTNQATVYLTKAGVQGIPGSTHIGWWGNSYFFAGHTNLAEAGECTGQSYDDGPYEIAEGSYVSRSGMDNQAGLTCSVALKPPADETCWHFCVIWISAIVSGVNTDDEDHTIQMRIRVKPHGYPTATLYWNEATGAWVGSDNTYYTVYNVTRTIPAGASDIIAHQESLLIRTKKSPVLDRYIEADIALLRNDVRVTMSNNIKMGWNEVGTVEGTSTDPLYLYHIRVPVAYTGDLNDLLFDACNSATCDSSANCCALSGDIRACPDWSTGIIKALEGEGLIMDAGSNLIVTSAATPCESETAVTADPPVSEENQGANVVYVGGYHIAVSRDCTELQISDDGFATHTTAAIPGALGTAFGAAAVLLNRYVVVYGDAGVALYDTATATWIDVTGDLALTGDIISGGETSIGATS